MHIADLVLQPLVRVVPLKGARAEDEGRLVPLCSATARGLSSYLRVRRYHRYAAAPQLWLGLRNCGPMDGWGLYRMLQRRAEQAGYAPDVHRICSGTRSPTTGGPPPRRRGARHP